ncbi:efflux RND transporter periplasmic adaptor subunit [Caulobacter sp. ErkDOM-E]|uniref:efflux RND transporter periplasmic adaptor subunit n=1 Tax=Caulobacter sp. ErkDOM-E TaxID=3402778 RepID=UPI003AF68CDD
MRAIPRPWFFIVAAALVVALTAWVLVSRRPPQVAVVVIEPRTIEQALSVVGRARPAELIQVSSPNPGQVISLLHDEGDQVLPGDPMAVILASVEQAQTDADAARARAARAQAKEAQLVYQRTRTLHERGFAAKAALDAAKASLETAQANVAAADAGLRASTERSREFTIRAPMAGVVLVRPIDNGQVVAAGAPLFQLGSARGVEIRAEVEEAYADRLSAGQTARAALSGSPGIFAARVTEVSPRVDSSTGGRTVRLAAEGSQTLTPGRSIDVTIVIDQRQAAIVVPRSAVVDATAAPKVYVVNAANLVEIRKITVARWPSVQAIVESGLKAGDRVVLEPTSTKPGAHIEPVAAKAGD